MKKKKEDHTALKVIIVIALILISVTFIYTSIKSKELNKRMDEICKEEGFNKKTDRAYSFGSIDKIECDYKYILNISKERECLERDKWDHCLRWTNVWRVTK